MTDFSMHMICCRFWIKIQNIAEISFTDFSWC